MLPDKLVELKQLIPQAFQPQTPLQQLEALIQGKKGQQLFCIHYLISKFLSSTLQQLLYQQMLFIIIKKSIENQEQFNKIQDNNIQEQLNKLPPINEQKELDELKITVKRLFLQLYYLKIQKQATDCTPLNPTFKQSILKKLQTIQDTLKSQLTIAKINELHKH